MATRNWPLSESITVSLRPPGHVSARLPPCKGHRAHGPLTGICVPGATGLGYWQAMRMLKLFGLLALSATPAFAGATPWQDVAPGARLRLISSDTRAADGTTTIGLELDMPDADKTYWRLPGETGIPTEIDVTGSSGVSDAAI